MPPKYALKALPLIGVLLGSGALYPAQASGISLAEVVSATSSYFNSLTRPNLKVEPPNFHIALRGEQIPWGCYSRPGDKTVYGSHYCPATKTIVLEVAQLESIRGKYGTGGVAFVIAHEYAHFMQDYAGIRLRDPYQELHADCMGASLLLSGGGHAVRHLGIRKDDIVSMVRTVFSAGGGEVHGTSSERLNAFMHGAENSLIECDYYAGVRQRSDSSVARIHTETSSQQRGLPFTWISKNYFEGLLRGQVDLRLAWPVSLGQSQFGEPMKLKYYNVYAESNDSRLGGAKYSISLHVDMGGKTVKADYSCLDRKYAVHPNSIVFTSGLRSAIPAPPEMTLAFQGICNELIKN